MTISAKFRATLLAIFTLYAVTAQAQELTLLSVNTLPRSMLKAWHASKLPKKALSLVVREVDGQQMLAINAKVARCPASLMKLLTTWGALSELGPDYIWHTEFFSNPGERVNARGVLPGPLYWRAGGDPLFLIEDMWQLLHTLRLQGIKQIKDVVIDRSRFGTISIDPGSFDGASDRAYNASPDALMVNFGAVRLLFSPDSAKQTWKLALDPPLPNVKVLGDLGWEETQDECVASPEVTVDAAMTSRGIQLSVAGKISRACGEFSLYRIVLSQQDFAAAVFRLLWQEMGGTFTGKIREGRVPPDAVSLARHESRPLAEVIRAINKRSNNVMARLLLLTLGAERGQGITTQESSVAVLKQVLARQGLVMPELVVENGSGLSRLGRVSADSLASLLIAAWHSPYMPEFVSSLAVSGVEGTMQQRLGEPGVLGRAHLKTGTLKDVRALAGYVTGVRGKRYVVVCIINDTRAQAAQPFEDALITWLATGK